MPGGTSVLRSLSRMVPARALRGFGRPMAFHFHGVEDKIDDPRIQFNHHARDAFYRIAKTLKSDFRMLPLSALPEVLMHPERHTRSAFLMADDGYRNNLVVADMLEAMGIPWTLFVSTHHIDTGDFNPFTAARLFYRFAPNGAHPVLNLGAPVVLGDAASRETGLKRGLKKLRTLDSARVREAVGAMIEAIPADRLARLKERYASERFLNWPEVAQLAARGVEIGAHAHYHWPMHRGCSRTALLREAQISRQRIENQVGPCRYFAYPVGNTADISRDAWQAVREAGFSHAFTTLAGSLDGGANPWLLPRYGLQRDAQGLGALAPMLRAANPRLAFWQKRLA